MKKSNDALQYYNENAHTGFNGEWILTKDVEIPAYEKLIPGVFISGDINHEKTTTIGFGINYLYSDVKTFKKGDSINIRTKKDSFEVDYIFDTLIEKDSKGRELKIERHVSVEFDTVDFLLENIRESESERIIRSRTKTSPKA